MCFPTEDTRLLQTCGKPVPPNILQHTYEHHIFVKFIFGFPLGLLEVF